MPFVFWNSFDLRFHDRDREVDFIKYVETKLVTSTAAIAVIFSLCFLYFLVRELRNESAAAINPYSYSSSDVRSFRFVLYACNSVSSMVVFFLALLWFSSRRTSLNWELVCISMTTVVPVFTIIGNRYSSAKLFGQNPDEAWADGYGLAAVNNAIILQLVLTLVCLFVPIRMHLKWIPSAITLLTYVVCFASWGTPEKGALHKMGIILLTSACSTLWGACFIERDARQKISAQGNVHRKSHELEVQHAGASRILESLCDAVLELGSDFSILNESPRLGALLFHPSLQDMKGKCFCDLIASTGDRARFISALEGERLDELGDVNLSSGMVQVRLRDYHGRDVSVYLYHARTFGLVCEECCNLVALVEAGEHVPPDVDVQLPMGLTSDGVCCSSNSEMALPLTAEASADIAVWVNVTSPCIDIVRCTPGFTVFGPIAPGASFLDIVEDSGKFVSWVQRVVNAELNDMEVQISHAVTLKLRSSPHSNAEYSARCIPDLAKLSWEEDAECNLLCLVFDQVTCRSRPFRSTACKLNHGISRPVARGPLNGTVGRMYCTL